MNRAISFSLMKCKTKAGYSAKLKTQQKLNLEAIKKKFKVVLETPILLVIEVKGMEVIIHGYGELLFKESHDSSVMEKIVQEIYEAGLEN